MLKVSLIERPSERLLIVEGKLVGPWAAELRNVCQKAKADLRDRELVLDIKHMTAISQEGENLLSELMSSGIKFRSRDVFAKHVLKQLSRRALPPHPESRS
jgi:hypothetical protein